VLVLHVAAVLPVQPVVLLCLSALELQRQLQLLQLQLHVTWLLQFPQGSQCSAQNMIETVHQMTACWSIRDGHLCADSTGAVRAVIQSCFKDIYTLALWATRSEMNAFTLWQEGRTQCQYNAVLRLLILIVHLSIADSLTRIACLRGKHQQVETCLLCRNTDTSRTESYLLLYLQVL
jgi:hypothetical protein